MRNMDTYLRGASRIEPPGHGRLLRLLGRDLAHVYEGMVDAPLPARIEELAEALKHAAAHRPAAEPHSGGPPRG